MKKITDVEILNKIKDYNFYHYTQLYDKIITKCVNINQKQVNKNLDLIKRLPEDYFYAKRTQI